MKKLIILIPFLLSGCLWQTVNSNDIEVATKVCASSNSTVVEITAAFDGSETVQCSNRKIERLSAKD